MADNDTGAVDLGHGWRIQNYPGGFHIVDPQERKGYISDAEAAMLRDLAARLAAAEARENVPDDLRADGWAVAVHNDYRQNGEPHTFWLLTKGNRCVKGEGRTDAEALNEIRKALAQPTDDDAPTSSLLDVLTGATTWWTF